MNKKCTKCEVVKDVNQFYIRKNRGSGLAGYSSFCKDCQKKENYQYKLLNQEKYKEYNKIYREKNKEYMEDYITKWRIENEESLIEKRKEYYQKNKEKIVERNYKYCVNRCKHDTVYKLKRHLRSVILRSIKLVGKKSKKTIEILGCSFEEFKLHLESKFDDKMNWENQGTYWHMDHIIPISSAKTEEDVYRLNHYTNFQPLFWLDNLKKSNKIE